MKFKNLPASPVDPSLTYQSLVEFGALWDYVAFLIRPRHVVEIGSLYGGTLWHWCQLPTAETVWSVDLVTDSPLRAGVLAEREKWQEWSEDLHIIEGSSQSHGVLAQVTGSVPYIDLLFIDGDHTYEGVRADFDLWSPHVRVNGLVAFHDTVANGTRDEPGVRQLVEELKRERMSVEFFDPTHGAGITAFVL